MMWRVYYFDGKRRVYAADLPSRQKARSWCRNHNIGCQYYILSPDGKSEEFVWVTDGDKIRGKLGKD